MNPNISIQIHCFIEVHCLYSKSPLNEIFGIMKSTFITLEFQLLLEVPSQGKLGHVEKGSH